jgi:hypothetical protein
VTSAGPISTAITVSIDHSSGTAPLTVTCSGKLTRTDTGAGLAGKVVNLVVNGTVETTTTTDASGNYSKALLFDQNGSFQIIASYSGGS